MILSDHALPLINAKSVAKSLSERSFYYYRVLEVHYIWYQSESDNTVTYLGPTCSSEMLNSNSVNVLVVNA